MSTPTNAQKNQALHWNTRQAAAKSPQDVTAVWYDACRTLAKKAEKTGDASVWNALASHLNDFFQRHTR